MKLNRNDFRKLQLYWYKKLAEAGFLDIEQVKGDDLILRQTANYCYRKSDEFTRSFKEEYFYRMYQIAQDPETEFRNDVDKYILQRHSDGASAKEIVDELTARGDKLSRHTIRFIVRRYEVSWGIKTYKRNQLNKYD